MNHSQSLNYNYLLAKLDKYARNQFTGRLTIQLHNTAWRIYLDGGSMIWATGGIHPVRRWLRQLKQCGCQITVPKGMTQEQLLSACYECWDYFALASLMQDNYINSAQVKSIVEGSISEILFDLVYSLAKISPEQVDQITMLRKPEVQPCPDELLLSPAMWDTESVKQQILLSWQKWVAAGLSCYSPDLGIIANPEELKRQGWHALAQSFQQMEEKEQSLRDIAVQNNQNLLSFLRTIKSYYHQNLIQLKSVPDLWQYSCNQSQQPSSVTQGQATGPMVKDNQGETAGTGVQLGTTVSKSRHYVSLGTRSSQVLQSEQGIKVNVMEELVAVEATRQIQTLSPTIRKYIKPLDVVTYALNRLPPLYASSQEGIAHQTNTAKQHHQLAIQTEVQRAIAIVRRDPLRRSTRITSRDQVWV